MPEREQRDPNDSLILLAQLAAIVESSDDAIVGKSLDGTITSWNKSAERIFGYTAEEAIGRNINLVVPDDRRAEAEVILAKIRAGEHVAPFETVRRHKNGTTVELSVTVSPIRDASGQVVGASKTARETGRLNQADRTSALFAAIVDSSDDAIISKNLNSIITS